MTTVPNVPGGQTIPPVVDSSQPNPTPDDLVSDEWRKRILNEKKTVQAERDALKAQLAERDRKDLEARGEFQKIAEIAKAEANEAKAKLQEIQSERLTAKKAAALLKALENGVPEKFYGFLPMDDVLVDPDTGEINALSVAKAAEEFRKNYPELLVPKNGPRFPNQAPQGNNGAVLSREEWLKLPVAEMKKRRQEVVDMKS